MRGRVAVVGGGIVGCAAGAALARAGWRVTLIEQGRLAAGTTGASFAWLNATSKWEDEPYFRLNEAGLRAWMALAAEAGADAIGLGGRGALLWAEAGDAEAIGALRRQHDGLRALGHASAWLDAAGLARAAPEVRFGAGARGLLAPDDRLLDAPLAARFLAGRLRSAGGAIVEDARVAAFDRASDGRVTAVRTTQGTVEVDAVLLAAGPATGELAALALGREGAAAVPLDLVPGLLVDTPPVPEGARTGLALHREGAGAWHARGMPGGSLRLGAEDTDAGIATRRGQLDAPALARTLVERAAAAMPGLPHQDALLAGVAWRVGIRPIPRDGRPIVGPLPGAANLFVAVTHSGVTLALHLAEGLARRMAGGEPPADLARYGAGRFAAGRA